MEQNNFVIGPLTDTSPETAEVVRNLAKQLGKNYKELTDNDFAEMLNSTCNFLFAAREKNTNKIVGMVTVIVYRIPYAKKAYIEDIVVDEAYRSHGIGKKLLETAVAFAKEQRVAYVQFTSNKARTAGNALYQKMGFQIHDTNVYRLKFSYEEN